MWQRWNQRRTSKVVESLKTKPRPAKWFLSKFGSCSEPIKKLTKSGVQVQVGRSADPDSDAFGHLFWWVESNRASLKKSKRKLRIKELA